MATATLSSKNQITLPIEMIRALGLKGGDKLDIELIDGRLVIWPKPASYADYFLGSMKGYWGASAEEVDQYVREEQASWNERREQVLDLLAVNPAARWIVETLRRQPGLVCGASAIRDNLANREALEKLITLGAVRKIPNEPLPVIGDQVVYRLSSEYTREPV